MYKRLRYQAPLDHIPPLPYTSSCSGPVGTVLGFACSVLGKAPVQSLHTGHTATPLWTPSAKECHENMKLLLLRIQVFLFCFFLEGGESLSSNCFASRAPNGSFPILQPKGTQWSCLWTGNGLTSSAGGGGHRSGSESSGRWVGSPPSPANRRSALVQR